ncbi:MFS transporter [Streptomyces prunicolor]
MPESGLRTPVSAPPAKPPGIPLYLGQGGFGACLSSISPTLVEVQKTWPMTHAGTGSYPSLLAASMIASGFGYARCAARWGRARVLASAAVGVAASAVMFALATGPATLLATTVCLGLCSTAVQTGVMSALADRGDQGRARRMAVGGVCASVASLTGPSLVTVLAATSVGWRGAWWVIALVFLALAVLLPRGAGGRTPAAGPARSVAGEGPLPRAFWIVASGVAAGVAGEICVVYFAPQLMAENGITLLSPALVLVFYYAGELSGRIAGVCLALRADVEQRVLSASLLLALTGFGVFWLVEPPVVRLCGLMAAGAGIANFFPFGASSASGAAGRGATDRALAGLHLLVGVGTLCAPLALGVLSDAASLRSGLVLIPVLFVTMAGLLAASRSPHHGATADAPAWPRGNGRARPRSEGGGGA